jgi:hypothetical protein
MRDRPSSFAQVKGLLRMRNCPGLLSPCWRVSLVLLPRLLCSSVESVVDHYYQMSPLKKRAKVASAAGSNSSTTAIATTTSTSAVLVLTCESVDAAFDAVAKDPESEDHWITVATLQQRMLQKIRQQEEELQALRERRFKREQEELATQYERDHLLAQIEVYRTFPLPNLEQLAREECRKAEQSWNETTATEDNNDASREEILSKFLQVDINDPDQKEAITNKLQKCFEHRAELGKKVQVKRQALQGVQQELKAQQDFLTSLPMHIQTLERASQSLVKFMQKNGLMHPLSGNERLQRLRRAQTLPAPMYTLFALLQHAIDERCPSPSGNLGSGGGGGITINIANDDRVVLQFPLPDVINGKKSRQTLSIVFSYDEDSGGQVKVEPLRHSSLIYHPELLLEELFEGDSAAATNTYSWANQLAGLHPVATAAATISSTGLVLREMERRIQANAVLSHCLSELQRGKVPTPPGTEALSSNNNKSATFTKAPEVIDTAVGENHDVFDVVVENAAVDVKVQIHRHQYPVKPPIWAIPLDKTLEQRLNVDLLQAVPEDAGPWLLIHQVRALLDSIPKATAVIARRGRSRILEVPVHGER